MKAKNFRKPNSFIYLPNIEPQGMVPGSGNASVSETNMVSASWTLKLVGRQMIGKETKTWQSIAMRALEETHRRPCIN